MGLIETHTANSWEGFVSGFPTQILNFIYIYKTH